MVNTQQAQMQLDELKHGIIGLFKSRGSNNFELVTDVTTMIQLMLLELHNLELFKRSLV